MTMTVSVRLFAVLRERAGTAELELELPDGARVADALERLRDIAGEVPVVMAVNRVYAGPEQELGAGDELALIPPVSGGGVHVQIREEPLSIDSIARLVRDPRAGAVVVFAGVTREVSHLDYEAYAEMAREQLEQIAATAIERHGLCRAAVEHRIGNVPLSEPSVVVAASAPHRGEAFAGAREIIDEVKARAPIWKREEGVEWVEGTPPAAEGDAVKLVRTGCAAISRLDADACVAICDPDVEFESRITAVDDATYRGHDGVRRYIARLADAFDWLEITPLEVIEGDDRGVTVARFRARGRGSGVEVERRFFQAARLRDGRALWWGFFDSKDEALAAVGLRD